MLYVKYEKIGFSASEKLSFENVDTRRTTDGRQIPAYTISSRMSRAKMGEIWVRNQKDKKLFSIFLHKNHMLWNRVDSNIYQHHIILWRTYGNYGKIFSMIWSTI